MQYSPKLKKAAAEIKEILNKYDIAANVVLHTPGHSEFVLHLTPTYSCAWLENDMLRFRAKKEDYNGNTAIRDKKILDTVNMLHCMSYVSGQMAMQLIDASQYLDKITGAEHDGSGLTSHTTQNN